MAGALERGATVFPISDNKMLYQFPVLNLSFPTFSQLFPISDKGMLYEFRVSAANSVDFGEEAKQKRLTPDGVPSGAPTNVTVSAVRPDALRVSWNPPPPTLANGRILMYSVSYKKCSQSILESSSTNTCQWQDTYVLGMSYQTLPE